MEDGKNLNQLSYEDLKIVAEQAIQQAKAAHDRLQTQNFSEVVARLNFAFKVLEFADRFPKAYVENIVNDIMALLPMAEAEKEQPETKNPNRKSLKPKAE